MTEKNLAHCGRTGALALLLAALLTRSALAWIDTPFDTTTAAVMQGALDRAPNKVCSTVDNAQASYPSAFVFHDNDPGQDHLYQTYDFYNNGPGRCVALQLRWTHQDCGNIRIGLSLYLDHFNPADPTENLLAFAYEGPTDISGPNPVAKRYSGGYYYYYVGQYFLDDRMRASAVVPALSKIVAVLDSYAAPGDDQQCPIDPATSSLVLLPENLDQTPLTVEVHDTSGYEFNPPGGASLAFYVELSTQFSEPFTVDYATANGTAFPVTDYDTTTGQLTFAPGETTKLVHVPIVSDTTDETPPASETMTLTLANPSSPYVALAQAAGTGTIFDDDDTAGLCHITNIIGDGDLPVGKVGVPYGPVDLRGFSASFDPTLDYDWTSLSGTLPPGILLSEVAVEDPPGSANFELHGALAGTPTQPGTYTFNVHLTCPVDDPDPGTPPPELFDAEFTIVIEPEGPQALLTLPDESIVEGNVGLSQVLMTIHLSQALPEDLPLEVLLLDGSAQVDDADYLQLLAIPQPTQVNAGNAQESFTLDIVGDTTVEIDEDFLVVLRTPITHEVLATATVTIVNDDSEVPVVEIPTLGDLGFGLFALGLAGAGLRGIRRRRETRPGGE